MTEDAMGLWGVPLAVLSGAIRVGTPFLFISLGECITEKSGRVNVGLEGVLLLGAVAGFAATYHTGSPWLGVLAAIAAGCLTGILHAGVCSLPGTNDIAVGIAMMLFLTGLAFFFGKPYLNPPAAKLPDIDLGFWSDQPQVAAALRVNALFLVGLALVPLTTWVFHRTRWGLVLRTVGDSRDAALALGLPIGRVRLIATAVGSGLTGIAGAFLSLYYPGTWNEGLGSGEGLMALVLVIFARWRPVGCFWAGMLFGGAGALSPALQAIGISEGYEFIAAIPYALTLGSGCFHGTEMEHILRNRGIRNLIFVGVTTECCVHTSMREASDRGFDNLLLEDCTAGVTPELKEAAIAIFRNPNTLFGTVGTSDAVITALS